MYLLRVSVLAASLLALASAYEYGEYSDEFMPQIEDGYEDLLNNNNDWNSEFPKLAGSGEAIIDQAAYAVSIRKNGSTSVCSGFIISATWVMTAAHCVFNASAANLTVRAGTVSLDAGGTVLSGIDLKIHSLFSNVTFDYDYALIQLNATLPLGSTIKVIALPPANAGLPIAGFVFLHGWGVVTTASNTISTVMRGVKMPLIPKWLCQNIYGNTLNLTDRMFCAGIWLFGGKGGCLGDGGTVSAYKEVAIGLVTLPFGCGDPAKPTVFALISPVTSWVKGTAGIP